MPRKKKRARDLTKDEVMKRLFPKEIRDAVKRVAHERDRKDQNDSSQE